MNVKAHREPRPPLQGMTIDLNGQEARLLAGHLSVIRKLATEASPHNAYGGSSTAGAFFDDLAREAQEALAAQGCPV